MSEWVVGSEWQRVICPADCNRNGICPVCDIAFTECRCPRAAQDDEYDYCSINGVLMARRKLQP